MGNPDAEKSPSRWKRDGVDLQALEDRLRIEIDPAFFHPEKEFRCVFWYTSTVLHCAAVGTRTAAQHYFSARLPQPYTYQRPGFATGNTDKKPTYTVCYTLPTNCFELPMDRPVLLILGHRHCGATDVYILCALHFVYLLVRKHGYPRCNRTVHTLAAVQATRNNNAHACGRANS